MSPRESSRINSTKYFCQTDTGQSTGDYLAVRFESLCGLPCSTAPKLVFAVSNGGDDIYLNAEQVARLAQQLRQWAEQEGVVDVSPKLWEDVSE